MFDVSLFSISVFQALREAHEQFKASLKTAEEDFNQLAKLDQQIKSFNVGANPYTWFTMEALEDTWRNLQKIIRVGIGDEVFRCYPEFSI
jgi:spectrin alpha